jgi:hypothetical protein
MCVHGLAGRPSGYDAVDDAVLHIGDKPHGSADIDVEGVVDLPQGVIDRRRITSDKGDLMRYDALERLLFVERMAKDQSMELSVLPLSSITKS